MKEKTCCFTGHRYIPANDYTGIQKRIENELKKLISEDVVYFGTCVCYLTKSSGGTSYTVGYAQKRGLRIINLAEKACPK